MSELESKVKIVTPVRREEKNPSREGLMEQIKISRAGAVKNVNDLVKHINALIQDGALIKEEILDLLSKHLKVSSHETPLDSYLKSPQGGHYDKVMANLLDGDNISHNEDQSPTFRYLIRSLAIRVNSNEIPFAALPTLEAPVDDIENANTLSM